MSYIAENPYLSFIMVSRNDVYGENALDNIAETAVQKAFDEISKDHTVTIISHRLSTIVDADKIVALGDGLVLEEGTLEELMRNKDAYSELY